MKNNPEEISLNSTENLRSMRNYWTNKINKEFSYAKLLEDMNHGDGNSEMFKKSMDIDKSSVDGLLKISNDSNDRVFVLYVASLYLFIYKISGNKDIRILTPSFRNDLNSQKEESNLILDIRLSEELSFKDLILLSNKEVSEVIKNQNLSLKNLIDDKKTSGAVAISFENIQEKKDILCKNYGIIFNFSYTNGKMNLDIYYDRNKYSEIIIDLMLERFSFVLKGCLSDINQKIDSISAFPPKEKEFIINEFSSTNLAVDVKEKITDRIFAVAKKYPDRVAIVHEDNHITYKHLNRKALGFTSYLIAKGVGNSEIIPVVMGKSIELSATLLGIMYASACFVIVDPTWPVNRIETVIKDTNANFIFLSDNHDYSFESIEILTKECLAEKTVEITPKGKLSDPIFAIYTSGTTGKPKASINIHEGIANRFQYMNKKYGCGLSDNILMTSNAIFDAAIWQMFWPLCNGAKCVIPGYKETFNVHSIIQLLDQEHISVTDFVPSVFNLMVTLIDENEKENVRFKSLRQLLIGGEAMSPNYINIFNREFPKVKITNTYGPSETSIGCIFYELGEEQLKSIPIGKPIDNVKVLLLNEKKEVVPFGSEGEIYLGGKCVGRGYLNKPELTYESFINKEGFDDEVFYKTGDRASYKYNGDLNFKGRKDSQLKIRGVRVELKEIETRMNIINEISDSIVVPIEINNEILLCGYYLANKEIEVDYIIEQLITYLPEAYIPSFFVYMDNFPLTPNGKLDIKALPHPKELENTDSSMKLDDNQLRLVKIWSELLKTDEKSISINSNFFHIGGNSLNATILIHKMSNEFGVKIPLVDVFKQPTIKGLSNYLELLISIKSGVLKEEGELNELII